MVFNILTEWSPKSVLYFPSQRLEVIEETRVPVLFLNTWFVRFVDFVATDIYYIIRIFIYLSIFRWYKRTSDLGYMSMSRNN